MSLEVVQYLNGTLHQHRHSLYDARFAQALDVCTLAECEPGWFVVNPSNKIWCVAAADCTGRQRHGAVAVLERTPGAYAAHIAAGNNRKTLLTSCPALCERMVDGRPVDVNVIHWIGFDPRFCEYSVVPPACTSCSCTAAIKAHHDECQAMLTTLRREHTEHRAEWLVRDAMAASAYHTLAARLQLALTLPPLISIFNERDA